ncbi:MAG: hypothetical protein ACTSO9_03465 [Candidatus Helarchaeota archaeon]
MSHKLSEIPKDLPARQFVPLGRNVWRMYRELGFEKINGMVNEVTTDLLYDTFKIRLNESIQSAKDTIEGKVEDPSKTISYMFFPTVSTTRVDLQQGTMKLLYGESVDCAYLCINDYKQEILYILNTHAEDGIPVDWWLIGPDDEILDRRHMKTGVKIRDMPRKTKSLAECGQRVIDILKDIRNERTPQWSNSLYLIAAQYGSSTIELVLEQSNYESFGTLWSGLNAKRHFGLSDSWFLYIPFPGFLQTLSNLPRTEWQKRMAGLTTASNFNIQTLERDAREKAKDEYPDLYRLGIEEPWTKIGGVPNPGMSLQVKLPNLKDKKVFEQELFDWIYPPNGQLVTPENLEMDFEEICDGILFNINHEIPPDFKVTRDNIISTGIGRNTSIW